MKRALILSQDEVGQIIVDRLESKLVYGRVSEVEFNQIMGTDETRVIVHIETTENTTSDLSDSEEETLP